MDKRIIRVFPRRTKYTPDDELVFIGDPPMFLPRADEVHISVTFTWDLPIAHRLFMEWSQQTDYEIVKIGGFPFPNECAGESIPGMYIRNDVIFTSRGCNRRCDFCLVPLYEGKFRPVKFEYIKNPIIQDNNILFHEPWKLGQIFKNLRNCGIVSFNGGLDSRLIDERIAYMIKELKIGQIFLACDTDNDLFVLENAVKILDLPRDKLRCYVLIGRNNYDQDEKRLQRVFEIGCLPFAQLYQPPGRRINYNRAWKILARI